MDRIVIQGGRPLIGDVRVSGAKNAALPILISSLLTDGWNTYRNVPNLKDIESIKLLLENLGAKIETDGDIVRINAGKLDNCEATYDFVRKMRASILVLCPLVARMKRARVSLPGGCAIGARPINLHLKGLVRLGAAIELKQGYVEAFAKRLRGDEIYFDVPTVTGTENLIMAAVMAEGTTVLRNAAREPEIVALADVLNKMGSDISGAGTSVITIRGVSMLHPVSIRIIPDRIEAGTFMAAAALTKGDIKILDCNPNHLRSVIHKLRLTGASVSVDGNSIHVTGRNEIKSIDIKTAPFPGFPTDLQAQFMALMSVSKGFSIISENIFENRFIHVSELKRLGADITISGNTALVKGVSKLSGTNVMATDLRASASLILAGLIASGTTIVHRVYHLDRGYDAIEKKIAGLGASIARVKE